eukprot:4936623-Alexandrium_andersonii.AAC.1
MRELFQCVSRCGGCRASGETSWCECAVVLGVGVWKVGVGVCGLMVVVERRAGDVELVGEVELVGM